MGTTVKTYDLETERAVANLLKRHFIGAVERGELEELVKFYTRGEVPAGLRELLDYYNQYRAKRASEARQGGAGWPVKAGRRKPGSLRGMLP